MFRVVSPNSGKIEALREHVSAFYCIPTHTSLLLCSNSGLIHPERLAREIGGVPERYVLARDIGPKLLAREIGVTEVPQD